MIIDPTDTTANYQAKPDQTTARRILVRALLMLKRVTFELPKCSNVTRTKKD
jgi:hypothetical protein